MSAKEKAAKQNLVELDPNFLMALNGITAGFKFIGKGIFKLFSLLFFLALRAQGKTVSSVESATKEKKESEAKIRNTPLSDTRAFSNYGSTRWVSDLPPLTARKQNRKSHPDAQMIDVQYMLGKELKKLEVVLFGDISDEQVENIESALLKSLEEKQVAKSSLKEIHIIKDLGKFLDSQGVPDSHVPGFTLDSTGACLINEDLSYRPDWCKGFISYLIQDDLNYQTLTAKAHNTLWNQSDTIRERLKFHRDYRAPDSNHKSGTLRGRHIIDSDSKILGGVYLSHPAREALTVDKNGEIISAIFTKLLQEVRKIKEALGINLEEKILQLVVSTVQKTFPRSTEQALRSARDLSRVTTDEELSLDYFIKHECGDIEHKALLAAYLLDRLKEDQEHYLQGSVSIDRNWMPGGGHVWVRYSNSAEDIYIVDPVKNFCGRLDDYSNLRWPYERKADLIKPRVARPVI